MLENTGNEQQNALQAALASFDQPAVPGKISSPMTSNTIEITSEGESSTLEETTEEEDTVEDVEQAEEEEKEESPFAVQFKETFGIEPDEAVALVDSLSRFKEEMTLMREWAVAPGEYDSRMKSVKEFYTSLPEDKREQFNNPEGAKAIWEHLSKNAPATGYKKTPRSGSFAKPQNTPKKEFIKRSEILAMDDKTYSANYARITRAYAEGRVLEE